MSHVDTYSIDTTVPVPPHTYVNASYVVMEENFETTWTSDVYFTGCLFTQLYNWYFEGDLMMTQMSTIYGKIPGFSCEDNPNWSNFCDSSICKYTVSGKYVGAGGAKASLKTASAPCTGNE